MHFGRKLSSLVLLASLAVPVATFAQDHHDDHNRDHRYYDRGHKDYHNWDSREDGAYRRWLADNHRSYREFGRLNGHDQQRYWAWRHDHPDNDRRDDRGDRH
jgi:hypothetical protein